MAGSVFFMLSSLAAFVLPSTGDLLDASVANSGTFLGAVCFFWAARMLALATPEVAPGVEVPDSKGAGRRSSP